MLSNDKKRNIVYKKMHPKERNKFQAFTFIVEKANQMCIHQ